MRKLWWAAVPSVFIVGTALANYTATQGAGTTYASVVLGGTTHYLANMLCDFTNGETQCAAVSAGGAVKVDNSAVTQPVSVNTGTNSIGKITDVTNVETTIAPGTAPANAAVVGCVFNTAAPTATNAQTVAVQCDTNGNQKVTVTNANANGNTTMSASSPVTVASDQTPIKITSTTGNIAANNTTGVNLKASAGVVTSIQLGGIGSAPAYLKLYNKASAPTCGTDTPVKRLIIPAAATAANGAGSNVTFGYGLNFSLGIGYCVTTGITDADTTAPAANTYLINIDWQ